MLRSISILVLALVLTITAFSAITTVIYTGNVTETCTLASLTSSASTARSCMMVNNTSNNDVEAQVYVKFKTGTGTSASGFVQIFAYACVNADTSRCTDAGEIVGTDVGVTIPSTTNLPVISGIPGNCFANVDAKNYVCGPYSIAQTWGNSVPAGWGIVVQNQSGATFDATCTGCGVFFDRLRLQNQ